MSKKSPQFNTSSSPFQLFIISAATCIVCWILFLSYAFYDATHRSKNNFLRCPEAVKDLSYPLWLLHRSRIERPDTPKLIYFGDSTVLGTSSSDDRHTIPYELSQHLDPKQTQILVFAMPNLGMKDFEIIAEKNFHPEDYIIMDWIPIPDALSEKRGISKDQCSDPTSWKQAITLTRNFVSISYGKAPGLIPFDFLNYTKRVLQQKTVRPVITGELCKPLPLDTLRSTMDGWIALANQPLSPSLLAQLAGLFQRSDINPKHVFIYLAPINPVLLGDPRLGANSTFAANRKTLAKLVHDGGGTLVDYDDGTRGFQPDHFHDAVHLVDKGCLELGRQLAQDWKKTFSKN